MAFWPAVLLLLLPLLFETTFGCPDSLTKGCQCQIFPNGLFLNCPRVELADVVETLRREKAVVQKLQLNFGNITRLTNESLFGLPMIRQLDLSQNNIEQIDDDAFAAVADGIEEILLHNNDISQFPNFGKMPKLQSLNLNGNQLTDIPLDAFSNIPLLKHLRLEKNNICDLKSRALSGVNTTLELLDLSDNCLRSVPAAALRNSRRLMYLDLGGNRITAVPRMNFVNLPLLKELRLDRNQISRIEVPMALMNVPELQYLYLQDNQISELEPGRFELFERLQVLNMADNRLTEIPKLAFSNVKDLRRVLLDRNDIEVIRTLAFSSNPKLQVVSLKDNAVSVLEKNAFVSCDELVMIEFANNSLTSIGEMSFAGVKNLKQLNLRNNTISTIEPNTFASLPGLTTLNLAHNQLKTFPKDTFHPLTKLFWLDMSNNLIEKFEEGVFNRKVSNIILNGNPLQCDESMDAFVRYLVRNNVRTFLPNQPDVTCSGPPDFAGTRLKELMIKRANQTFFRTINSLTPGVPGLGVPFENLFPSIKQIPGLSEGIVGLTNSVPTIDAITQNIPGLDRLPTLDSLIGLSRSASPGGGGPFAPSTDATNRANALGQALRSFTNPLTDIATRRQPLPTDFIKLVQSIPNLGAQLSSFAGGIDISKLDPQLIKHVLNGGQIPGVPKQILDNIVKEYYRRVAQAAEQVNAGVATEATRKILPAVTSLPTELVQKVLSGATLPGLTKEQTEHITRYYQTTLASAIGMTDKKDEDTTKNGSEKEEASKFKVPIITGIPPEELLNKLPANFDLTRVPPALLQQIASGRQPDLSLLPPDMLDTLLRVNPEWNAALAGGGQGVHSVTTGSILDGLPATRIRDPRPTYQPYDIGQLDKQDKLKTFAEADSSSRLIAYLTAAGLASVALLTVLVIAYFIYRRRRKLQMKRRSPKDISSTDDTVDDDDASAYGPTPTPSPMKAPTPDGPMAEQQQQQHYQHQQRLHAYQQQPHYNPATAVFDPYRPAYGQAMYAQPHGGRTGL